ncbi:hypothetical protein JCM19238_594 [Vibrio ponticus]|nr:hypothetical protein JCM19238_594 [Vibrio ponticus]
MKQPLFWLALVLTLVAISILVNLGMWQLNRAEQKLELQNMLASNEQQTAIRLTDFDLKTCKIFMV